MSDLVKSKRQAPHGPPSPEDHSDHDDETAEQLPDVSATPKATSSTAVPSSTPKPAATGTPKSAVTGTSSSRLTLNNIKAMMEDITQDLKEQHKAEIEGIKKEMEDLKLARQKDDQQASPFETPRATRPQDLAYQHILTTSKETMKERPTRTLVPTVTNTEETLKALVKIMENSNSKETTTDLPKFTGKDAQWERWYELLRSYFQAKGWLTTFDHHIGPGTPDNLYLIHI